MYKYWVGKRETFFAIIRPVMNSMKVHPLSTFLVFQVSFASFFYSSVSVEKHASIPWLSVQCWKFWVMQPFVVTVSTCHFVDSFTSFHALQVTLHCHLSCRAQTATHRDRRRSSLTKRKTGGEGRQVNKLPIIEPTNCSSVPIITLLIINYIFPIQFHSRNNPLMRAHHLGQKDKE